MNIYVCRYTYLCWVYTKSEIIHKVCLYAALVDTAKQFSNVTILTVYQHSGCYTSLPILGISQLSKFGHFSRCVVRLLLICTWLMTNNLSHFTYDYWPFGNLLWRSVCSSLLPIFLLDFFVFFLLVCRSSLCVLDTSPICIPNIFFHAESCIFTFPIVSFDVQKFSILL